MRGRYVWYLGLQCLLLVHSFVPPRPSLKRTVCNRETTPRFSRTTSTALPIEPRYYAIQLATEIAVDPKNTTQIDSALECLVSLTAATEVTATASTSASGTTPSDLESVRGLYEVSYVKTVKIGENPVGGKWTRNDGLAQRVFRTRRSFQHILGINETGRGRRQIPIKNGKIVDVLGEAVNVISLSALWGAIRVTVILRGDVIGLDTTERTQAEFLQPLSCNAIRALFDSPRIVFGRTGKLFNFSLGPRTSVVLDSPYVDNQIRLGLGARSGTRFVFRRCSPSDSEANEFRELLYREPVRRVPLIAIFGCVSLVAACKRTPIGAFISLLSFVIGLLVGTSGGGIERNDRSISDFNRLQS